jgi:hypothetical protein
MVVTYYKSHRSPMADIRYPRAQVPRIRAT